jgi:hypothetical protein
VSKHTKTIAILAMLTVAITTVCTHTGVMTDGGPSAWLNGVAAVVTAVAYLAETHRTSRSVTDLTIRVSKLEAKS